jgi:putative sensory transduction regulator
MLRRVWVGLAAAVTIAGLARADDFDARRAKDIATVVTTNGASGDLKVGDDGKPTIAAQAARIFFDVDFDDCDTAKALCGSVIFSGAWDTGKVTIDQLNRWNRWTLFCPAYLDAKGEPDMWDAIAVSQGTSKDEVANDVERWMGCLQDFDDFVAAPDDFLKRNAPSDASPPATPTTAATAARSPSADAHPR